MSKALTLQLDPEADAQRGAKLTAEIIHGVFFRSAGRSARVLAMQVRA